ncbi:FAD-dependent oxidoreductase [Candidatus Competibacter phosphatis]|uniref:FAD-dependent oxidoreductase n=1 Tax=Candidatus Competibacter phosphatis TaxID=221280 RepID=UPI00145E01C5|nr:FAD-dependent oxidoreductase [Candidatus Competibacter phosphatis]
MSTIQRILNVDAAIVGGGIAGLWLLARLRERGYSALLIESERLGAGQTICAQGIVHGGAKYSLHGQVSRSAEAVAGMPELWRRCLRGEDAIDLRGARLLAEHQYLWATGAPISRLAAFFASKLMRSRMDKVAADAEGAHAVPVALRHPAFHGTLYRLDEPVLDVASVLTTFAERYRDVIARSQGPVTLKADGTMTLHCVGHPQQVLRPAITVFTAGAGNIGLPWVAQQLRPLHMVLARGINLPGPLYAHCLGASDLPQLTVTSHFDADGRLIWYLGGGLAEEGIKRDRHEQIRAARRELSALLPWVDWNPVEFATFTIQRAEAQQPGGGRPAGPGVFRDGRVIAAWPTKLALAPLLAEQIEEVLRSHGVRPRSTDLRALMGWPRPEIAVYPWDRDDLEWS